METNKKTRTLKVRYEKTQGAKESSPCVFVEVEVDATEVDVFVENVHQERLREADDPSSVERWSADDVMREVVNKPEYNQAKKFLRHTAFEGVADDEGEVSAIEASLTSTGTLTRTGLIDPTDSWAGEATIWVAINSLPTRDKHILIDVRLNGLSQTETASKYGISQPAVRKSLQRSTKELEVILGDWL